MSELTAGPSQKCAGCEFDRSRGEYVHRVWFCADCLLKMSRTRADEMERDRNYWQKRAKEQEQQAGNVLAVIHRDGGHYISKHGWEKACKDAQDMIPKERQELEQLRYEKKHPNRSGWGN